MCLTNDSLYNERDQAISRSIKIQGITETWLKSHQNQNKIILVQIPDQCEIFLRGNLDKIEKFSNKTEEK